MHKYHLFIFTHDLNSQSNRCYCVKKTKMHRTPAVAPTSEELVSSPMCPVLIRPRPGIAEGHIFSKLDTDTEEDGRGVEAHRQPVLFETETAMFKGHVLVRIAGGSYRFIFFSETIISLIMGCLFLYKESIRRTILEQDSGSFRL